MQKHFERDYSKLVQDRLALNDKHSAMAQSIGGNFSHFGIFQRELLFQHGLAANATVLDVGCGAGRLANALKELPDLNYIGIDVIQELLDYAREISNRPEWQFYRVNDFKIPLDDNSVDMVTAFSLFTHLLHEESYAYLAEFRRVLKPGGKIIFSYLDYEVAAHWTVFITNLLQLQDHLNQFIDASAIKCWCKYLHLHIEGLFPGDQAHIQLNETVAAEDGSFYRGKVALGQSVGVLQKPEDSCHKILAALPEDFNVEVYLQHNPDIAASPIDPAVHFIMHGQFENRRYK